MGQRLGFLDDFASGLDIDSDRFLAHDMLDGKCALVVALVGQEDVTYQAQIKSPQNQISMSRRRSRD